jgi:hypothetical protein
MKKIEVEIEGIASLLHHRFAEEDHGQNKSKVKKKVYVPEEEAEKACYRKKDDGTLFQPSEHILGALIKAGTNFKYENRKTFKDIIKAGIIVTPDNIPLLNGQGDKPIKNWDEIDARSVVVQRARVIRWRPKFNKWRLKFEIEIINDDELSSSTLKDILDYAGKLGIGDYRPRFGRFMVTSFKEVS